MVTQKEIAQKLGLSRTTVARAINGSSNIKKETKQKILELVLEMNYQKNYIGSSLASKKKKIVTFIVKSKNSFYTEQIKRGIRKIKEEYKYHNFEVEEVITDIEDAGEQILKLKEILQRKEKIEGILITPLDKKKVFSILKPYLNEIEVVSMSIELNKDILYVGSDYFKEGKISANIVNKILRADEKLLVIDNGDDNISSGEYLRGFLSNIDLKRLKLLGPFKMNGVKESINFLNDMLEKEEIASLYINRYAQDILKKISFEKLKDKKIIVNGMGNGIKKLIEKEVITATVADDIYETGYKAGKLVFDVLYRNKEKKSKKIIVEPKIIFLENLE